MGSWNKTCGLSKLHITAGTPVYIFVLEDNKRNDDRCYTTALYYPTLMPFYGVYNDYGGGEECHGVGLPYIIDGIKESLIEMELGENERHDIAIKKEGFDVNLFFDGVHKHRLKVNSFQGDTDVDFVMMRADIVDGMLNNWVRERYVGDGKSNSGSYNRYTFTDILNEIDTFIVDLKSIMGDIMINMGYPYIQFIETAMRSKLRDKYNLVSYITGDRHGTIIRPLELIVDTILSGDIDVARALLIDFLKASFIDSFMDSTRNVWVPGCHEGSQNNEHNGYRLLTALVSDALDREQAEYDEY